MIEDIKKGNYEVILDKKTVKDIVPALEKMELIINLEMDHLDSKKDIRSAVIEDSLSYTLGQIGMVAYNLPNYVGRRFNMLPQPYRELVSSAVQWMTST